MLETLYAVRSKSFTFKGDAFLMERHCTPQERTLFGTSLLVKMKCGGVHGPALMLALNIR